MRFDDSLDTVLAADSSTPFGAQTAWRQLVDLIGRGRAPAGADAIARLRAIRAEVPPPVRAASARGLEQAHPPAELVALFVEDEVAVAAPVVRSARLDGAAWIALLPTMSPPVRALLRNRRDLDPAVGRALASYGPSDFILPAAAVVPAADVAPEPPAAAPEPAALRIADPEPGPFVSVADAARELPVVVEARRLAEAAAVEASVPAPPAFPIADLVARIEAYRREHEVAATRAAPKVAAPAERFRFETDAAGLIRWVEGVDRAAVIGIALDPRDGAAQVDGIAAGAYRRRSAFGGARLEIGGCSDAAGDWLISGVPVFEPASGRFTGYRGTARRPRADERADPVRANPVADSLRQLVHELRTPTNAIVGFAEMIESELLGPVPPAYRERANAIRRHTHDLLGAIDDIDLAARIETRALDLRSGTVALGPALARVAADLAPLAELRGATLSVVGDARVDGDDRAIERLLSRLLATLVAAAARGETVRVGVLPGRDWVTLRFDRPRAFAAYPGEALFTAEDLDGDGEAPLLGSAFAFRLARNLAGELGGSLTIDAEQLTLRLRAAVDVRVGQASI